MRTTRIIEPVQAFGTCLKGILEKQNISASELARMMNYKSRNSIFRILEEAGGHSARQVFFERLISEDPLALSDAQKRELFATMCRGTAKYLADYKGSFETV